MMGRLRVILLSGAICLLGATSALAIEYKESPMLRTRVAAGLLPPVEKRLPENPMVLPVLDEIGQYGGTMRGVHVGEDGDCRLWQFNREPLLEAIMFTDKVVPSILESWEVSEEGKVFTFRMRKGMRYSDGHPVTVEDVRFTWEDVLLNDKLTPTFPAWLEVAGEPAKLEIIDDWTFRITFAGPYALFPLVLHGYGRQWIDLMQPKHYMEQFHIRYTPLEKMAALIKQEGFAEGEWWSLYLAKMDGAAFDVRADIGFPTLNPWMVVDKPAPGITIIERNPYYWKVDEAGNQLPYIDTIRAELVTDEEMGIMKILAGEVDFDRSIMIGHLADYPLLKEYAEEGGYRVVLLPSELGAEVHYFPNLTHPDPVWRKIINDVRFRKALSLGINREEIMDTLFLGFGTPASGSLHPESKFIAPEDVEAFTKAYVEYDPQEANRLLDEMGLDKRDSQGWRLRPDGKRLTLPLEIFFKEEVTEIVVEYWRDLGIEASMKMIEAALWFTRQGANETVMSVWHQCHATDDVWPVNAFWFVPYGGFGISWGSLWQTWDTTGGKEGEEPPAKVKRLLELNRILQEDPSEENRMKAGREIVRSQYENVWRIAVNKGAPHPIVVAQNMGNVPGPEDGLFSLWVTWYGEQLFFRQ